MLNRATASEHNAGNDRYDVAALCGAYRGGKLLSTAEGPEELSKADVNPLARFIADNDVSVLPVEADVAFHVNCHVAPSIKAEASGSSDCGPWRELESFNNLCCAVKRTRLANAGFTVFSLSLGRDSRSNPTSPCNTRASGVGR